MIVFRSHVAAAIFKALFGYVGFLTFMEDTREEVVNNLEPGLKTLVNLILVVKALLSYPLPYYAACELLEKEFFVVSTTFFNNLSKERYQIVSCRSLRKEKPIRKILGQESSRRASPSHPWLFCI
jgi:amino acid permease